MLLASSTAFVRHKGYRFSPTAMWITVSYQEETLLKET